ncbi:hypothetical protein PF008_g24546 [Phytophthora fragariae]|uniref:Uncharacterized protein n=1 Tax=Phytophthora fragariae TaxID=53985 RepID=A0A6G0QMK9_9STRA|nr:hypothetical protein PF008_g24546 [Phytophthora fragariae]
MAFSPLCTAATSMASVNCGGLTHQPSVLKPSAAFSYVAYSAAVLDCAASTAPPASRGADIWARCSPSPGAPHWLPASSRPRRLVSSTGPETDYHAVPLFNMSPLPKSRSGA